MNNYYWTKNKPTEEGWYWMKQKMSSTGGRAAHIVQVRKHAGTMCIGHWEIPSDAEWAGPIEEPIGVHDVEEYYKE